VSELPRVGISRCLLGDEVRYDGGHRREATLLEALGPHVEWVPVCPEVEMGMSTPREPIQLVASTAGALSGSRRVRLLGVETRRDWTDVMVDWRGNRLRELSAAMLSGFVLKARSPSCGLDEVPIAGSAAGASGRGLFAQAVIDMFPDLPVEDEVRLRDADTRAAFLQRVRAHHRTSCGQQAR
jgi:uncharacterized protein YbbK (DUF523 family)